MTMPAAGFTVAKYLRISAEDRDIGRSEKTESNSITNQRSLLEDFIRRTPELAKAGVLEFCDDGWSGKSFERPALKEMLERVKRGEIQCIVVKDLSRFGRDYLTAGQYLSCIFPFLGVRFIAVNDGYDSFHASEADGLEMPFQTLLYDFYSRELSDKVKDAAYARAKRGMFLSPYAPYGYIKDPENKRRLIIDREAAEVVRYIFQSAADGNGTMEIARALNKRRTLTPMQYKKRAGCSRESWPCMEDNHFWTHGMVTRILRDERYIGKTVYGKRRRDAVGRSHTRKAARQEWVTVSHTHEGIVTEKAFQDAQARLRRPVGKKRGGFGQNPLGGKVRCEACGRCMARISAGEPYYVCRTPAVTDEYGCSGEHIPEKDLLEILTKAFQTRLLCGTDTERVGREERRIRRQSLNVAQDFDSIQPADWISSSNFLQKELAAVQEQYAGLNWKSRELYEKLILEEQTLEEYLAGKKTLIKRREELAMRTGLLKDRIRDAEKTEEQSGRDAARRDENAILSDWLPQAFQALVKEITVGSGQTVHILWNFRESPGASVLEADGESLS